MHPVLTAVARTRLAPSYLLLVAGTSRVLAAAGPSRRARAVAATSTNLHNLGDGRAQVLLASAVVTDEPLSPASWALAAAALVGAEALWGPRRAAGTFALGHVGASLGVAAGLTGLRRAGRLDRATVRAPDVGISYGLFAVLGALATELPRWPTVPAAGGAVALGAVAAVSQTFTDAGHLTAFALGLGAGAARRRMASPRGVAAPVGAAALPGVG